VRVRDAVSQSSGHDTGVPRRSRRRGTGLLGGP
jgi:hypothetical protein